MPEAPKSIVYLRPDTLGDLVIFSAAIRGLMEAWPRARHTMVVRTAYSPLAELFPAGLKWCPVSFNPFSQKPSECREGLESLVRELRGIKPDVVVAATINRTWLELAVAAAFPKARRVALGDRAVDPLYAKQLELELGANPAQAFGEIVEIDPQARDWENNHRLASRLVGRELERKLPAIEIPAAAREAAAAWLKKQKLAPGNWLAMFVGGLANVPIKAWPDASYAELVRKLQADSGPPVVLMAHESEAAVANAIADQVGSPTLPATGSAERERGGKRPVVWLGRDGELPLLAALLSTARAYAGNDTGAMHIAAAAGRPVLGIFGGGHWPRFRPAARQGVSVVQPLPCFGCNWDCEFGHAPCVKLIPVPAVHAAIGRLLAAGEAAIDEVSTVEVLPPDALRLIAAVTPRYRALQLDRVDRQHRIEELKSETDSKDTEIDELKRAADERKTEMEAIKAELEAECAQKDTEIAELKAETNTKDTEIADLKRAADERKAEMEAIKAELEAECAEKDTEIAELKAEADSKDAEIEALKQVCNEREALIFTQAGHIKNFQASVKELSEAHGRKDGVIRQLETERAALQARAAEALSAGEKAESARRKAEETLAKLPADSSTWADIFSMSKVHVRNLEAMIAHRDADIEALKRQISAHEQSLENHARGYGSLEAAKHYGRLLAEKEAAIQNLHKACVAREEVIKQLAADTTGLTSRLRKLTIAARAHARENWYRPFKAWVFKKVVEDFWMQIGVLQHYPPRPLKWDRFPTPRLPVERLPQIAIVTPSFQQATFVESTLLSVINQKYPKLLYAVQDGGSTDGTPAIVARHAAELAHWESARDKGQADAVRRGFSHVHGQLGPDDVMGWLNSDDFIAPRALRYVGEYFATHPEVDCVYGHRIIIDGEDREVGRWIMPTHDPRSLEWIDYVPQETLFWRRRAWDLVGGIDTSFQFALDWDLLARFTQAGMRIVRLPYFLGCFRVHPTQKTSAAIHTTGADEMARVRSRFHGAEKQADMEMINRWARQVRFKGALHARLHAAGIRW